MSLYWTVFVGAFLAVAVWESLAPAREMEQPTGRRWANHGVLLMVAAVVNGFLLRITPLMAAEWMDQRKWGLAHVAALPGWAVVAAGVIVLDFVSYATHWTFHHVSWLWPIHEVHHTDLDFDVSTGARFHPLEVLLTQAAVVAAVALLGLPSQSVALAGLLVAFHNFFEHANASLPAWLERSLRWWLITPDLHRIHHSVEISEQTSNYGQAFPFWDRLFGTFRPEARSGQAGLITGLDYLREQSTTQNLGAATLLFYPFRKKAAAPLVSTKQ